MRVLFADLEVVWRGGQNQALLLLRGLRAREHEVELLSLQGSALSESARAESFTVHACAPAFRRLQAARLIHKILRKRKFDVVHANEAHALTAAWLARAHREAPLVVSRRVAFRLSQSAVGKARYSAAQRVIAISHFVAQSVIASGISADIVRVVYDGVELPPLSTAEERAGTRARWKIANDDPLVGCVGYLLPEKGQESLVRALPAIRARIPNCRLLLAGEGPCRSRLEKLAEELHVESAITFLGHVKNVSEVYEILDLFAFSSAAEPLGSSLLVAMSYGLPVIAVDSGGVPEVLDDSCGILLPNADPAKFADAAITVLLNRQLAKDLGAAARERIAQRLTADRMVEDTLKVYSGLKTSQLASS